MTEATIAGPRIGVMPARDHVFYPALAVLISATGFAGFSFTCFGPIIGAPC